MYSLFLSNFELETSFFPLDSQYMTWHIVNKSLSLHSLFTIYSLVLIDVSFVNPVWSIYIHILELSMLGSQFCGRNVRLSCWSFWLLAHAVVQFTQFTQFTPFQTLRYLLWDYMDVRFFLTPILDMISYIILNTIVWHLYSRS